MPRRSLAAAMAVALAAGGLAACSDGDQVAPEVVSTSPASSVVAPPPSPGGAQRPPLELEFESCGEELECGELVVPLDHDDPDGATIRLRVQRAPAEDPDRRIGALLVNPGGPGAPGTLLVQDGIRQAYFSEELRARFDVVSWDPRGTGATEIDCVDGLDPYVSVDPTPDEPAEVDRIVELAEAFAAACEEREGDLLPHVSTIDTARDLDLLREALGEEGLTYFGFSYGAELGATYASLFPERVRALVLDGAVSPALGGVDLSRAQALGFELALEQFLEDCAADDDCPLGDDPGATYDAVLARLDAEPARSEEGRPPVGQGVAYLAVVQGLYSEDTWPDLADALAEAGEGDGRALLSLYDDYLRRDFEPGEELLESFTAISCLDDPGARDLATYERLAAELARLAPRLGVSFGWGVQCGRWPVEEDEEVDLAASAGAPPILLVGTTGDPATPYVETQALAEAMPTGVLLTWDAPGHTAYLPDRACVREAVDAYLIDLAVPAEGTVCRP